MFNYQTQPFGEWEKWVFQNTKGDKFSIVPGRGATVLDLKFNHQNILDGFKNPEELAVGSWGKSALLFPFPNRLKNGMYEVGGKKFQFPINDKSGNNAIHGLGRRKSFEVKNVEVANDFAKITCQYQDAGMDAAYPFPFLFEVTFCIKKEGAFEVEMNFTNQSTQKIPVGLGWHPYFQLSQKVDDSFLQMPDCQLVEVDEEKIPTGKKYNYTYFKNKKRIGRTVLDNCFEIKDQTNRAELFLEGEFGKIKYWQACGERLWNLSVAEQAGFIQVFTPPARKSIAIEPMTCNVNAFQNGDGLVLLEPGENLGGKFGVVFYRLT